MKILQITATYPPSANGVAVSVSSLLHELNKLGHDVCVLAPRNGYEEKDEPGVIRYPSVPNPVIKDYPIPLLPINRKVIKLLTKEKYDIVHAHHPFYISFFADLVSSINNIPFVFTYHTRYGEYVKSTLDFLPKRITNRISDYTSQRVSRNADVIVVPSYAIKRDLQKKDVKTPIEVIPTGLPKFRSLKISKLNLRERYEIPKDNKILLCVSRLGKEKNVLLLLKSLKMLPDDFFLVLVGTGPQENDLKDYAKRHNIAGRIKFIGKVQHEEISKFYLLSDIFAFPSLTETQGLTLLEASYFGLPTVAVDSEVNNEWLVKGASYYSKNNPVSFKKAIISISKLDSSIVEKKTKEFARKYSAESTTRQMISLYNMAIKKGRKKKAFGFKLKERVKQLEKYLDNFLQD